MHLSSGFFKIANFIIEGNAKFLNKFLQSNRQKVESYGSNLDDLCRAAEAAIHAQRASASYFEGKYQLVFGNNRSARKYFVQALLSPRTSLKHKSAAFVGVVASMTSRKILLALSNVRTLSSQKD